MKACGALGRGIIGTTPASSSASYSTSWTPPAVGSYYWTATYSGDGNYLGATSACCVFKEKAAYEIEVWLELRRVLLRSSGTVGLVLSVGDKATVTGNDGVTPTGTVRSEERRVGKECRSRWSPYH